MVKEEAFNSEDFMAYLDLLRKYNKRKLAVFMDQLMVHRAKNVKEYCERHDIMRIFNCGYSPEFNPIEGVFSQVKRYYVKERVNQLARGRLWDQTYWARKSFDVVNLNLVRANIEKSMRLLKRVE